jgi:hypothetical protein
LLEKLPTHYNWSFKRNKRENDEEGNEREEYLILL